MDKLCPELMHRVCYFLDPPDTFSFRLVCQSFGEIGACYSHPVLRFHLHEDDFVGLRMISRRAPLAKHVKALVYFGETGDTAKMTFDQFFAQYMRRVLNNPAGRPGVGVFNLSKPQLEAEYDKYCTAIAKQTQYLEAGLDFTALNEVIPRFQNLQSISMSSLNTLDLGKGRKSPFRHNVTSMNQRMKPTGCRHLESLLGAISGTNIRLKEFRAGFLDWRFFDRDETELQRLLAPLTSVHRLELHIYFDTGRRDDVPDYSRDDPRQMAQCHSLMKQGQLKRFLQKVPNLEDLTILFSDMNCQKGIYPAALEDIIPLDHKWPRLRILALGDVETERQHIMRLFDAHKETLRGICLRDIGLKSTSWLKLIVDIRERLHLDAACICGCLRSINEDGTPEVETWTFPRPEEEELDCHREIIEEYCTKSPAVPDVNPLAENGFGAVSTFEFENPLMSLIDPAFFDELEANGDFLDIDLLAEQYAEIDPWDDLWEEEENNPSSMWDQLESLYHQ